MKLVFEAQDANGYNIAPEFGKVYKDFRGEEWVLDGCSEPQHGGSTGRVFVHKPGCDKIETSREFFPGVMGMTFIETVGKED